MKLSEISTKEFEKLKKEAELKRFLQLLTNIIRPCEGCPIYRTCILPVRRLTEQ
jgi:hypothetical protein